MKRHVKSNSRLKQSCIKWSTLLLVLGAVSSQSWAGPREQAKRIHDRLAGTHPSETVLDAMEAAIIAGNETAAANMAMDNDAFYNATLKNFITPWTNEEQTVFAPLNDYTATVIGLIRDEEDFRTVLSGDVIYVGANGTGAPAYSMSNNAHYEYLEDGNYSLKDNLERRNQSQVTGLPAAATAGIMTTRAAAKSFFIAGTNRAMFRFTLMNYMCNDLEQMKDITRTPDRIRQDVARSPGGDSRVFLESCVGCHNGMDPLAQAFAYYNYEFDVDNDPDGDNGRLVYNDVNDIDPVTGTRVTAKYFNNNQNFKFGFVTTDDKWDNYWREGQNAVHGWAPALSGSGNGAKSMGEELANSETFAQCQVEKVFKAVCLRDPADASDRTEITNLVSDFKSSNYNLKQVFANSALYCKGD